MPKIMKAEMILGPYKEPLRKVTDGFGYFGAISFSVDGKIQCHICGEVFDNLSFHVPHAHDMKIFEYREKFGIAKNSKLVSESFRESRKQHMLSLIAGMTEKQKRERTERLINAARKSNRKRAASLRGKTNLSPEAVNVRGICPDQLIALINDAKEHYTYTPSILEFNDYYGTQRFIAPIKRTFGSWKKALGAAGLHPKTKRFGGHVRYTDEELLNFLISFYEENGTIPTTSDIGRGFLPNWNVYIRRFGSMTEARRLAGIPEWSREHYLREQEAKGIVKL